MNEAVSAMARIHAANVRRTEAEFTGVRKALAAVLVRREGNNVPLSIIRLRLRQDHGYTATESALRELMTGLDYRITRMGPAGKQRRNYVIGVDLTND